MKGRIEERLENAVTRIMPDEAAKERILAGVKAKRRSKKQLAVRIPAAAAAACLLLGLLWFGGGRYLFGKEVVVVYAATEEYGWQRLKEGERILLKQEPYEIGWEGEYYDERGRCNYYPYRCIFRVETSEDYLYDEQMAEIGDDVIWWQGDTIEWQIAPERPEDAGVVRKDSIRLWIVSDNIVMQRRERIAALELELTKEDGKCYAELKRVWETSGSEK